jgi:NAD(P)H dehydrogenase (quinone)
MKKILLNGVDGNFGSVAAQVLLDRYPHTDLIFTAPTEKGLKKYSDMGIETRIANFNSPEDLIKTFSGADTIVLISMPFVGGKRRAAHKSAIDAAVKAGVDRIIYTSIVGAGTEGIDAYEVNDHVWTEAYIKSQPIHYLIMRKSQYAEAMVASFLEAYENQGGVLTNNMGDGQMAFISRDDCAAAAAFAAMSDWQDRVVNVNGTELMTIARFLEIASSVTGKKVAYQYVTDEENYAQFDALGVPRTTEGEWAETAKNFPFCSDGMVTFGRAIRLGQMALKTDDFEMLTGRAPLSVREIFQRIDEHMIGNRVSTDN